MSLDKLRAHLLISWTACFAFASCLVGIELVLTPHLEAGQLKPLFTNLCASVLPTIGLMTSLYFVAEPSHLELTRGQTGVALVLSYVYLSGITAITAYALWFGSNLGQGNGSSYETLVALQPIVVGVLGFTFGRGEREREEQQDEE